MKEINYKTVAETLFKRKPDAHKGDFGKVLIFAGSPGMAGAAVLCGTAALKSGAGLVTYLLPSLDDPILPVLQISVPCATCKGYADADDKTAVPSAVQDGARMAGAANIFRASDGDAENSTCGNLNANASATGFSFNDYTVIAAGCGLGSSPERMAILEDIIRNYTGILVLDADALNALARNTQPDAGKAGDRNAPAFSAEGVARNTSLAARFAASPARKIITPHPGEAKRLLGADKSRTWTVTELADKYDCISLLKGHPTLITDTDHVIRTNHTGNPGMATGGAGDVLTGVIAALAAQGYSPMDATCLGAYLHGKAGDLAAEALGEMGMTAADIAAFLPEAIKMSFI